MAADNAPIRKILILTSHGIRTNAKWQERLEEIVEEEIERRNKAAAENPQGAVGLPVLNVTFLHNDYKFFSLFSFINPLRRRRETWRFEQRLRGYVESSEYDEIHLVGHSFGTHIIGHSLMRIGDQLNKKIGTVILAGSVLPGSFPWDGLFRTGVRRLVNECGDNDAILVLNAILPLGSGLGGRRGFAGITGDHFRNRFFRFGHSGYFQKRDPDGPDELWFMRKYWVPLLLGEETTPNIDERPDSAGHLFKGWLVDQSEGLKWLVPLGLLAAVAFVFLYFALVWRTSFNLETLELAGRVVDDVERHHLDGLQARIDARQEAINSEAGSLTATLEGYTGREVERSYFPDQWQRARVAAKLAIRPRLLIAADEAFDVRFRGPDFAAIRFAGHDDGEEAVVSEQVTPASVVYDLRTGKPSVVPMWEWSGPYAASKLKTPAVSDDEKRVLSLAGINLQGAIEHKLTAALSGDSLSIWDIAGEKQVSTWNSSRWDGSSLVEAHPCGSAGDAVALDEDGRAWVLRKSGTIDQLTSPAPLVQVLGNGPCDIFAGVSEEQALIVWSSPAEPNTELADRLVQSFEFSPKMRDVVLVNSVSREGGQPSRADFLRVAGQPGRTEVIVQKLDAAEAAFSPSGRFAVLQPSGSEGCSVVSLDTLADDGAYQPLVEFSCPKPLSYAPLSLSQSVHFVGHDGHFLTTRAHRGSFGDSHLELRDAVNKRTDWLVRASRYDIISLDTTVDGTVIATTSGDSAQEGYGADRSFYVWSPYSQEPVYKDGRDPALLWEARQAWLAPDGSRAIVSWRRFDDVREAHVFETEILRLDPDAATILGVPHAIASGPAEWGFDLGTLNLELTRPCGVLPADAVWLPDALADETSEAFRDGCVANGKFFLRATVAGQTAQLRLDSDEGWRLRYREPTTGAETPLAYADGTAIPDDIQDAVSDGRAQRIFLAHKDGAISRIDFAPSLSATRIREAGAPDGLEGMALSWVADRARLRSERLDQSNMPRSIEFLTADGESFRRYEVAADVSQDAGAGGVFDMNDKYWSVVNVKVGERTRPGTTDMEVLSQRFLQNFDSGKRISYGCDGDDYNTSSNIFDSFPSMRSSETGRFAGAGNLAPTVGVAELNTEMRVFDLEQEKCLGVFEHGDEIYDFGINADGRLLVTRGLNETYVWHIPTHAIVQTIAGPTRIVQDEHGLRIISRADAENPGVWPIPRNVDAWLAQSSQ